MDQMSDQEKVELLKYFYDKARKEVDFLRERQDKIFTWSSNVLMILIGALLIVDPPKSPAWSSQPESKLVASVTVLLFTFFSIRWQQRTRTWHAENGQVVQKIERLLHGYDAGYFYDDQTTILFPLRWNKSENATPPKFTKRIFAANFVSATFILGLLAIVMIWIR
jgi:hypothetical protein